LVIASSGADDLSRKNFQYCRWAALGTARYAQIPGDLLEGGGGIFVFSGAYLDQFGLRFMNPPL
jgi:hypothetical protein